MESYSRPGYLSLKKAAAWADVSLKTVRRWIAAGLPVYQAGGGSKVLVKPQDIDQFLQKRQAPKVDVDVLVNETLREIGLEGRSRRKPSHRAAAIQPTAA